MDYVLKLQEVHDKKKFEFVEIVSQTLSNEKDDIFQKYFYNV